MDFSPEKCPKCGAKNIKKTNESLLLGGASRAGDLVLDYMDKRYLGGIGRQIVGDVKLSDVFEIEDEWECSSCGYVWNRHGKVKKTQTVNPSPQLSYSAEDYSGGVTYSNPNSSNGKCTIYSVNVEILDDKVYNLTQNVLKIFADCLRVPSVDYNGVIRADQAKQLRKNLAKWYNISVSSNISQCQYVTFADLASKIIEASRDRAKGKQTGNNKSTTSVQSPHQKNKTSYSVKSPLPGKVISVRVKQGQTVERGDTILLLESMLMENAIMAEKDCVIKQILTPVGCNVMQNDTLVIVEDVPNEVEKSNNSRPINQSPKEKYSSTSLEKNNCSSVQYKDIPSDLRANYQPSSDPQGKRNLPFKMKVEQVFEFNGKGHIATGTIETGFIKENDRLCVNGDIQHPIRFIAAEMFRKFLPYAEFDDNVGLLVDLCGHTVAPGDILSKLGEQSTAKLEEKSPSQTESTNDKEQEYIDELKECLANGSISDGERRLLNKIRSKLGISEERAAELEQSLLSPQLTEDEQEYLDAFKDAMDDGNISDAERCLLDKIKKYNNISDERASKIEKMV